MPQCHIIDTCHVTCHRNDTTSSIMFCGTHLQIISKSGNMIFLFLRYFQTWLSTWNNVEFHFSTRFSSLDGPFQDLPTHQTFRSMNPWSGRQILTAASETGRAETGRADVDELFRMLKFRNFLRHFDILTSWEFSNISHSRNEKI